MVGYREDTRNAVGPNVHQVSVAAAVYDPFQCHMAMVNDNADGLDRRKGISLQGTVAVDGPELAPTNVIVERRERQHLDLIVDLLHALNLLDDPFGVTLERRPGNLAQQRDVVALNFETYGVKDVVIRKHQDLMHHFT